MFDNGNFVRVMQGLSHTRANRWHGGNFRNWTGLEWAGAMCGEAGETANVAKKLRRIELAIDGNARSDRQLDEAELLLQLRKELADTFLYSVLLAEYYGVDMANAIAETFNAKSIAMGFPERVETW